MQLLSIKIMKSKYPSLSAAISWTKKKNHLWDGQEQRWLDHNCIIRLSLKQETSRNAEFYVNDNPNHTIWYSQLTEVFIRCETLSLCSGETIRKNGERFFTRDMDVKTFINYVKDRTFRVSVNPDGEVAKFDGKSFPYGMSYNDAQKLVANLVKNQDYEAAAKYLLPATKYNLIEI